MAQTPPPPPPSQPTPSQPAPMQPAPMGATPSAAGTNKKLYSTLAYILGWVTGIIFLFVGKDDPDVKWNAANSVVVFGGLTVIQIIIGVIPGVKLIAPLVGLVSFIYWIVFLVKNLQGQGEKQHAPLISGVIDQYVDQVANAVK